MSKATQVVPVIAEELEVKRRLVETGRWQITKTISEREELVTEPVLTETAHIERVAVNQIVATPPAVRQEGGVLIIPLVEEVLVVEKRLLLREELHVVKRQTQTLQEQPVRLRREEVQVQRLPAEPEETVG